jgi:hypothetical protein
LTSSWAKQSIQNPTPNLVIQTPLTGGLA